MYRYGSTCTKRPAKRIKNLGAIQPREKARHAETDGGIRHDLVARVRREIAAGTYDTPEKLAIALERMLG